MLGDGVLGRTPVRDGDFPSMWNSNLLPAELSRDWRLGLARDFRKTKTYFIVYQKQQFFYGSSPQYVRV